MSKLLEIDEFEHGKIYYTLWYKDERWYPKAVKIYKDRYVAFEDTKEIGRFYWVYDLYVLKKGTDIKGHYVWQVMTYDTFEEAEKAAEFENKILQ